jgi:hypothetical protein
MPSTSPTCFLPEPPADALLVAVFFRLEPIAADFVRAAVVRVAPLLRDFEDAVFFAKLPPSSHFQATPVHCSRILM